MTDGNFEAKLCAIRKNKDGLVVSLVIHPHDASRDLMNLDIGARVMIGWAECTDAPDDTRAARMASENSGSVTEPPRETAKARTPFAELPLSQQAGLLCKDETFRAFLSHREGRAFCVAETAEFIREFCGVTSRAQLDTQGDARTLWYLLYDEFAAWKLTRQYAETIRT